MLYTFLLHRDENNPAVTPEEGMRAHLSFADDARAREAYVFSEAIGGTATATTVRVHDGKKMITDGPFAETKEVMGGFYILDCKDLDEALDYAAKLAHIGHAVDVRPVMQLPGWDYGSVAGFTRQTMS